MATQSLEELREDVRKNRRRLGRTPFAHNIIGLTLSIIAEAYGVAAANRAIEDFELESVGWKKVELPVPTATEVEATVEEQSNV